MKYPLKVVNLYGIAAKLGSKYKLRTSRKKSDLNKKIRFFKLKNSDFYQPWFIICTISIKYMIYPLKVVNLYGIAAKLSSKYKLRTSRKESDLNKKIRFK